MKKYYVALGAFSISVASTFANAADFSFTLDWGNIKKCTDASVRKVPNPHFKLKNVPVGTASIQFRMVDLDYRAANHGGGKVSFNGGSSIAPGAFTYGSPCPPNGRHTYEWTATATDKSGKKLGTAKARKQYP